MKKFKNIATGLVEIVINEKIIEQYEKYNDKYVEVKDSKTSKPKTTKPADENKDADKSAE